MDAFCLQARTVSSALLASDLRSMSTVGFLLGWPQDVLWRIQPDLIIELGSSRGGGGGGAFFYATVMQFYNPTGKVLSIGPRDVSSGAANTGCAHCMPANETALWRSGMIRFIRGFPDAADVLKQVEPHRADKCARQWHKHAVRVIASNPHRTGGPVRLRACAGRGAHQGRKDGDGDRRLEPPEASCASEPAGVPQVCDAGELLSCARHKT